MRISSILAGASAIMLAAAPVAAAPVTSPAVSQDVRKSADNDGASALAGGSFTAVILFAIAAGGLVALLASEDFGDEPNSP